MRLLNSIAIEGKKKSSCSRVHCRRTAMEEPPGKFNLDPFRVWTVLVALILSLIHISEPTRPY